MTDVDDELPPSEEELRDAAALARALEGEPVEVPDDAASTAAFLRAKAAAGSLDARLGKVEREVFGQSAAPSNVRRLPARVLGFATVALASAAALFVVVRTSSVGFESASPPMAAAPAAESAPVAVQAAAVAPALIEVDRALIEASPETREAAFGALRTALANDRDETLDALLAAHGGAP